MFTEIIPWINYRTLAVLLGLFLGLLGYRLHRVSLFFLGFMAGFGMSTYLQFDNAILSVVVGAILGLAFGLAGAVFFRFGLFLTGAIAGNALADIIIIETALNIPQTQLWRLGLAIVGGFAANALQRFAIIASTSLIGAFLIYINTKRLLGNYNNLWHWAIYTLLLIIFLIVQFSSSPRHSRNPNRRYSPPSRYRARY